MTKGLKSLIFVFVVVCFCAKPIKMLVISVKYCSFCKKNLTQVVDTLIIKDKNLGKLYVFFKEKGVGDRSEKTAIDFLDAIKKRKSLGDSFKVYLDSICDSCSNAKIKVKYGTNYVCKICGKLYKEDLREIVIQRKESLYNTKYSVRKDVSGVCSSKLCRMKNKHPSWSSEVCELIINGKVRLGMTKEQVIASWGKPYDINRTVGSWGVHEQWIYDRSLTHPFTQPYAQRKYLYFEDGILTSWQD